MSYVLDFLPYQVSDVVFVLLDEDFGEPVELAALVGCKVGVIKIFLCHR